LLQHGTHERLIGIAGGVWNKTRKDEIDLVKNVIRDLPLGAFRFWKMA
jgi:hypothetical protein